MAEPLKDAAFAPELCKLVQQPPTGDSWLHEVKWDGYRILATVVNGKARLWSRNAVEWTAKVPELAAAITSLKVKDGQFDGEMVVLRAGVSNFNALQGRLSAENAEPAIYVLFDMPYLNGDGSSRHAADRAQEETRSSAETAKEPAARLFGAPSGPRPRDVRAGAVQRPRGHRQQEDRQPVSRRSQWRLGEGESAAVG